MITKIYIVSAVITLLVLAGSAPLASPKISLSILVGSVTSLANFGLWQRLVAGWLGSESPSFRAIFPRLVVKILVFAAMVVIIAQCPIHLIGFVAGFSTVVLGIIIGGMLA